MGHYTNLEARTGVTVVLARVVFREHWGRAQVAGLVVSAFAIAAVSAG